MDRAIKNDFLIIDNEQISQDVYSMWLAAGEIAAFAVPGQFVLLYCKGESRLLPRPLSICETDRENGRIRLVYRVLGSGTKEFSQLKENDRIEVMGPLGNGFSPEGKNALLIGGGIGIPPLLALAKELSCRMDIVLGFRDAVFLEDDFRPYGEVFVTTEDGSAGIKGNVMDAVGAKALLPDIIYACGPKPMLRAVQAYAIEHGIKAQLSLEERMACGIGACLSCVCRTKDVDGHSNVNNRRICKDGPVFYADEVEL